MRSYGVYEHTTLGFIAKRFFFTFAHPNLAGSFYALPVACLLVGLAGRGQRLGWREILIGLAALAALLIPLGLTVSKHMLLSVALIAGAVVVERDHAPTWRWLGLAAALAVFVLFYLTVLFPFFPLQPRFPFFNHATWGMYTTHQAIYWRILFRDFSSVLIGVGPEQLREIYPTLANPEHIRAVLDQYQQGSLTESFCTYMDSHNEYLNTGTAFGLPALLALVAFWVSCAVEGIRQRRNELLLFFVVALLCCCLWDDLASKRWVWVALGMLVGTTESSREERI
jgi:O-antigen ligase